MSGRAEELCRRESAALASKFDLFERRNKRGVSLKNRDKMREVKLNATDANDEYALLGG